MDKSSAAVTIVSGTERQLRQVSKDGCFLIVPSCQSPYTICLLSTLGNHLSMTAPQRALLQYGYYYFVCCVHVCMCTCSTDGNKAPWQKPVQFEDKANIHDTLVWLQWMWRANYCRCHNVLCKWLLPLPVRTILSMTAMHRCCISFCKCRLNAKLMG